MSAARFRSLNAAVMSPRRGGAAAAHTAAHRRSSTGHRAGHGMNRIRRTVHWRTMAFSSSAESLSSGSSDDSAAGSTERALLSWAFLTFWNPFTPF